MQQRHLDRRQYFDEQNESTKKYVFPYLEQTLRSPINQGFRVLEIGCGEGGNLLPFLEKGCACWGVELNEESYRNALDFYAENPLKTNLHLVRKNIYDVEPADLGGMFDLVFLRDVIEHIPQQEKFMKHLKKFIKPEGVVFFAFPAWSMPFGGHQQICHNSWICRMPWIHLLPKSLYKATLKAFGETSGTIEELLSVKKTGISIRRFNKIIRRENYQVLRKTHWFINPNYETKFGLKPRRVLKILHLPFVQDFYTTAVYCIARVVTAQAETPANQYS